jgi:hypothetical protein
MPIMHSNSIDVRQLEAFAAVMSAGSVTGAARLLGRSQPAVTRLIQDLEADIGYALCTEAVPASRRRRAGCYFMRKSNDTCRALPIFGNAPVRSVWASRRRLPSRRRRRWPQAFFRRPSPQSRQA